MASARGISREMAVNYANKTIIKITGPFNYKDHWAIRFKITGPFN